MVGFQKRGDTYTGKLAYVIYKDEKGKLRKEASWNGWRDKSIESVEFKNEPKTGFVLNKGIQRYSDWGSGRSVIRVYDDRDFEFEVSVDNLLGILTHSDISKRDIQEKMVFAWYGTELVLLPENSEAYQSSVKYTEKQSLKVSTKDLIKGAIYSVKKSDIQLTYVGFYPWYEWKTTYDENRTANGGYSYGYGYNTATQHVFKKKTHVFWDGNMFVTPSPSTLAECINSDVDVEAYAKLVDALCSTDKVQPIVGFRYEDYPFLGNVDRRYDHAVYYKLRQHLHGSGDKNTFIQSTVYHYTYNKPIDEPPINSSNLKVLQSHTYEIRDGIATVTAKTGDLQTPKNYWDRREYLPVGYFDPSKPCCKVICILENGKEMEYDRY